MLVNGVLPPFFLSSLSTSMYFQLLPDGPELIERFIAAEGDTSARRSAFLFLYNEAEELAIDFLNEHMEDVSVGRKEVVAVPTLYFCVASCS